MAEKNVNLNMTLYELNAQAMASTPEHGKNELLKDAAIINQYEQEVRSDYYMLLCKEQSYYTVFTTLGFPEHETFGELVVECALSNGHIHDVSIGKNNSEVEIWIEKDEKMYLLHLFDYSAGIICFER